LEPDCIPIGSPLAVYLNDHVHHHFLKMIILTLSLDQRSVRRLGYVHCHFGLAVGGPEVGSLAACAMLSMTKEIPSDRMLRSMFL
jgi:hypothetical protein